MADTKISALAAAVAAGGVEIGVNDGGASKKLTLAELREFVHLSVPGDISPAQIAATTHDWAPTGFADASVIRFTTDASRDLTGIAAGSDGRRILLVNVGSFPIILKDENAGSVAGNRFALRSGLDDDIAPEAAIQLWYDSTSSRWRAIAQEALIGMPRPKRLNSQHSVSTIAPTKVTDLDMTLEPGTFTFDYYLLIRSATTSVAPGFNFNFTGTASKASWWYEYADLSATLLAAIGQVANNVTTPTLGFGMRQAENVEATTATSNMGPLGGVQSTGVDHLVKITGLIVVTAAGNLELWHGSETATQTMVEVGSSLIVLRTA